MQKFITHFKKEANGAWTCCERAELFLPSGRIEVTAGSRFMCGTTFMGIDLAALLDEQDEKDRGVPPSDRA
ncbi:MAG TPA: hypothetical protein VJT81_05230 [Burkholderiales bacterium]|nr:hypothetical protein [Burkholderiales bacterium]